MSGSYVQWKKWNSSEFGRFTAEQAIYYSAELKNAGITSVRGILVAEVGFGNGAFAGWIRAAGGRWIGREIIVDLQRRAENEGYEVIGSDSKFSKVCGGGAFDVMVAFDVIEHMSRADIEAFLREATESLRRGGLLILRMPSGDSPFSGAIYHGDLTHVTLLGSCAMKQLAAEAGFDVIHIGSPVLPVAGLGALRAIRRLAIGAARAMAFSFVRRVLMGDGNAVVSPNMVVVLRNGSAPR